MVWWIYDNAGWWHSSFLGNKHLVQRVQVQTDVFKYMSLFNISVDAAETCDDVCANRMKHCDYISTLFLIALFSIIRFVI